MSPEFLGDILDMRESLEDAKAAGDRARVGALGREIGTRQEEAMVLLRAGLENGGHDGELADAFARLKYYARFLDEVRAVEAEDD
jgi:hypothetical protein